MLRRLFGAMRSARSEFKRGTAASEAGRLEEGIIALRRALELRPDYPEACFNLGAAYRELGNFDAALSAFRRCAELAPRFANVHVDIASLLRERLHLEEAERSLQTALALKPNFPVALLELGTVRKYRGDWRGAVDSYRRAVELDPGFAQARWAVAMSQIPAIDELDADPAERRQAFERELGKLEAWFRSAADPQAFRVVADQQPFYLAYHEVSNRELLQRYGNLCASLMRGWQQGAGLTPPRARGRRAGRIRLGIVSAHIHDHSVWNAIVRGWVQRLDRDRFELHLFQLGAGRDTETARAASLAAAFHQGKGRFEQWAQFIHGSRMDALIYPEIGMDPITAKLAALRLAPVQATTWGHPETSGLPTIDHYLSGAALEPPDAQAHYTEALELLPATGCWLPRGEGEDGTAGWPTDLPVAGLRLICPGTPFKYAAQYDALLVAIARRIPDGKLVFFHTRPDNFSRRLEARLRATFERAGLTFERQVAFVPRQEARAFRAMLAAADLYLDTVGFSGFNTALQAVRCGLPVVTREGRFMRGRLASGMLRHIGLDELVATSDAAYVELAVALANDPAHRQRLRQRLLSASERLLEDDAPVRALEAFLARAVETSRA